jgi:hypothetical protein
LNGTSDYALSLSSVRAFPTTLLDIACRFDDSSYLGYKSAHRNEVCGFGGGSRGETVDDSDHLIVPLPQPIP